VNILVVNIGSSSIKTAVFEAATIGAELPPRGCGVEEHPHSGQGSIRDVLAGIARSQKGEIGAVVHRVVHGGRRSRPARITPEIEAEIESHGRLAPLHNPLALEGIRASRQLFTSDTPQIAVFDTAFHARLPPEAYAYGLPYDWLERGLRRYGFHGLSHSWAIRRIGQLEGVVMDKVVSCHLGSGCSLAAVRSGVCVDTTMGFTPLEGLIMQTRCGSVDPGLLLHVLESGQYTPSELNRILNYESGLRGLSGASGDMRELLQLRDAGDERAALAFDVWLHRLTGGIAAMCASLGGLDAVVFTGAIGERSGVIRSEVCGRLGFLGVELDLAANGLSESDRRLHTKSSAVKVYVIKAREEWEMAKQSMEVLAGNSAK
jgi:acetate kinase